METSASPPETGKVVHYVSTGGSGTVCVKDPSDDSEVRARIDAANRIGDTKAGTKAKTKAEQDARLESLTRETEAYRAAYLAQVDLNRKNETVSILTNVIFALLGAVFGLVLERTFLWVRNRR